ncbi:MAG: NAD-dependent epimerase/dehydratase family protein [Minisyncoccia bacterium]
MSRKMVVTGGAGFIGHHLVRALCDRGDEVHVIDRDLSFRRTLLDSRAKLNECDIRDREKLAPIMTGADSVFHLAAAAVVQDSIDRPVETTDDNVLGACAVFDAAVKAKVRRIVNVSSSAVYGDQKEEIMREDISARPMSPYGLQKLMIEEMAQAWHVIYGIETVSLRYFNVYGTGLDPRGAYARVMAIFLRQRLENEPLTITGDGTQTRDFVHVNDVVRATLQASETSDVGGGEVINIGSGVATSVNDIAQNIGGEVRHVESRFEQHDTRADVSRAKELLGWQPEMNLVDGMEELTRSFGLTRESKLS